MEIGESCLVFGCTCPACGGPADCADPVDADPSKTVGVDPGDLCVCAYCGSINCFERQLPHRLALRKATGEDVQKLSEKDRCNVLKLSTAVQLRNLFQGR